MLRWSGTAFLVRTVCSRGGGGGSRGISNHARIVAHYLSLGDDLPSSTSLATQELRWLSKEAKRQSRHIGGETAKFDSLLTSMVERLVRDHMPIAYIIGRSFILGRGVLMRNRESAVSSARASSPRSATNPHPPSRNRELGEPSCLPDLLSPPLDDLQSARHRNRDGMYPP